MIKGVLTKDTRVNLPKGTAVTLSQQEAWRLSVLGCFIADDVKTPVEAPKKATEAHKTTNKTNSQSKKKNA